MKDKQVAEAIRVGHAEKRVALKIDREKVIADLEAAYALAKAKSEPMAMVAAAREIGRLCGLPMRHAVAVQATDGCLAMYDRLQALCDAELLTIVGEVV